MTYRPDIDGLRAVAVLAVVVFHAFPELLPGGFVGVDVFFVISGYLITGLIVTGKAAGTFSFAEFYARRARRLLPALAVVLASTLAAGWFVLSSAEMAQLCRHVVGGVTFTSNFLLLSEISYFDLEAARKPLLHLWSLAIEEQFYLLWPGLLVLLWRWRGALIAVGLLASLALSLWLSTETHAGAFYLPSTRFWELLAGATLAGGWKVPVARRDLASLVGLLLIAAGAVVFMPGDAFPGWRAALPVGGAALLISAGPDAMVNRWLATRPMLWIGKISYPLYLWHWPMMSLALIANAYNPLAWPVSAALVAASFVLSAMTYRLLELPIRTRSWGATWKVAGAFGSIGAAALALTTLGLARATTVSEAKAFVDAYETFHYSPETLELYQQRCDFYDFKSATNKGAIEPSCTAVRGNRPVLLLWGDSHAQALWPGMSGAVAPDVDLVIIATSGCRATLRPDPSNGANKEACRQSNALALAFIEEQRPTRVFVAQQAQHELTDWREIGAFVRSHGGELVLVGPTPQWRPSLPTIVARALQARRTYIGTGLDRSVIRTNDLLRSTYTGTDVRFVSLIDGLCRRGECMATVEDAKPLDLLVMDYGHLMPAGSSLVATKVLKDLLQAPN